MNDILEKRKTTEEKEENLHNGPRIVVLGIGGGGCNVVNNMLQTSLVEYVDFAVCNTDAQALHNSPCKVKFQLGPKTTRGLGAGSLPEKGNAAARESVKEIMDFLRGCSSAEESAAEIVNFLKSQASNNVDDVVSALKKKGEDIDGIVNFFKQKHTTKEGIEEIVSVLEEKYSSMKNNSTNNSNYPELNKAEMLIVTAGFGGGTGSGATEVITEAARAAGILTIAIVTKPFDFEGVHRVKVANEAIQSLKSKIDTLIPISNQNLFALSEGNVPFKTAFANADKFLSDCIRGIVDTIRKPGLINVDFEDVSTVMRDRKSIAMMGIGYANGERRGVQATESAKNNVLLEWKDFSWSTVDRVLVCIHGGNDLSLVDVHDATQQITESVQKNANIIVGTTFSDDMEGKIRVFVFGTTSENVLEGAVTKNTIEMDADFETHYGSRHSLHESDTALFDLQSKKHEEKSDDKPTSNTKTEKSFWDFFWSSNKQEVEIDQNDLPDFLSKKDK